MVKFTAYCEIISIIFSFTIKIERSCDENSLKLNCNSCVFVSLKIWPSMSDH